MTVYRLLGQFQQLLHGPSFFGTIVTGPITHIARGTARPRGRVGGRLRRDDMGVLGALDQHYCHLEDGSSLQSRQILRTIMSLSEDQKVR